MVFSDLDNLEDLKISDLFKDCTNRIQGLNKLKKLILWYGVIDFILKTDKANRTQKTNEELDITINSIYKINSSIFEGFDNDLNH